ncbi:MAG: class I SAM-dependent DNA methyltransferase [Boseongicola sp.]
MADDPDLDSAYALETSDDNKRLYKEWAERYDAEFVDGTTFRFPALIAHAYLVAKGKWPCLDVGCGTGAVAEQLPSDAILDGLDLSPEMLAVAAQKKRYRHLYEANLKKPLPFEDASYAGFVSSGTFTHGHVGAEALDELVRVTHPGGIAVLSVKPEIWENLGFGTTFARLTQTGMIDDFGWTEEPIYGDPAKAPEGHGDDTGRIVHFRRI